MKVSFFYCVSALVVFIFSVSCQRDSGYYDEILSRSACMDPSLQPQASCRDQLILLANIDRPSFIGHPDELSAVIDGIYAMIRFPIRFPSDRKIFGKLALNQIEAFDFYRVLELSDKKDFYNREVVDYFFRSFRKIVFGCDGYPSENISAYYLAGVIHICDDFGKKYVFENHSKETVRVPMEDAAILFHEVRHQQRFHSVFCNAGLKCDKGMDGPHGWELLLHWGFLQGSLVDGQAAVDQVPAKVLRYVAESMAGKVRDWISVLPNELSFLKSEANFKAYLESFWEIEGLRAPFPLQKMTFHAKGMPLPADVIPSMVFQADLNNDGHNDIFIVGTDRVSVLLRGVDGQYLPFWTGMLPRVGVRHFLLTDLNGDGHFDALLQTLKETIIFWGVGDGSFSGYDVYQVQLFHPHFVNAPIVDAKELVGILDGFPREVIAILPRRGGSFKQRSILTLTQEPSFLTAMDVNMDGLTDLVIGFEMELITYFGEKDGTYRKFYKTPLVEPLSSSLGSYQVIGCEDMNRDGWPDIQISQGVYRQAVGYIFLGNGRGLFHRQTPFSFLGRGDPVTDYSVPQIADMNNDGYMDIVSLHPSDSKAVILYGTSWFDYKVLDAFSLPVSVGSHTVFDISDLDGDGTKDLIMLTNHMGDDRSVLSSRGYLLLNNIRAQETGL